MLPRQKRVDEAGVCYHAINRGNARQEIFHKPADYEAFIRVLAQGLPWNSCYTVMLAGVGVKQGYVLG